LSDLRAISRVAQPAFGKRHIISPICSAEQIESVRRSSLAVPSAGQRRQSRLLAQRSHKRRRQREIIVILRKRRALG
jgi:hypothetical protein